VADVISGLAYGARATLELCGDALTWRARPSPDVKENIATTIHDVRACAFYEQRFSFGGLVIVGAGVAAAVAGAIVAGIVAIALGIAFVGWRMFHARRFLVIDLADRRLVMDVDLPSAPHARSLVARIARVIESGEAPSAPASLP
jgi:hypothetical protein